MDSKKLFELLLAFLTSKYGQVCVLKFLAGVFGKEVKWIVFFVEHRPPLTDVRAQSRLCNDECSKGTLLERGTAFVKKGVWQVKAVFFLTFLKAMVVSLITTAVKRFLYCLTKKKLLSRRCGIVQKLLAKKIISIVFCMATPLLTEVLTSSYGVDEIVWGVFEKVEKVVL